jgi:tetratricopeptide (TPR) repeat protein
MRSSAGSEGVDALLDAANHETFTSPVESAGHFRLALDEMRRDDPRRAEALTSLGWTLMALGRFADAAEILEQARTLLLERGGPVVAAVVAPRLGNAVAASGNVARGSAILEEARTALDESTGPTLLAVMAEQAAMEMSAGRHEHAAELGNNILRLANERGLPPPPRALMAVGGDASFRRAIEIADEALDLRTASIGRYNRAVHFQGSADAWGQVLEESITFDRAHGLQALAVRYLKAGVSFFSFGRPDGVIDELAALAAQAREIGDGFTATLADATLVEIRVQRGEPTEPLDRLIAEWEAAGLGAGGPAWTRAMVALADGNRSTARAALEEFVEDGADTDQPWTVADACLRAGDRALAGRAVAVRVTDLIEHAEDTDARALESASAEVNRGRLAESDGDLAGARDRYERALRTFDSLGWGTPAGTVRAWLGRCLLELGETEEGTARLREARDAATRLGLAPQLSEIDTLLARVPA